jgi:hypothetical protein
MIAGFWGVPPASSSRGAVTFREARLAESRQNAMVIAV